MTEGKAFDLKERTFNFGVQVVRMVNTFPKTTAGIELGRQVMRSGTSVGANVEEADGAITKKDFIYKMGVARKEARETRYWLRMTICSGLLKNNEAKSLLVESDELVRILSKIIQKSSKK
jgi:four helix bundle protein